MLGRVTLLSWRCRPTLQEGRAGGFLEHELEVLLPQTSGSGLVWRYI